MSFLNPVKKKSSKQDENAHVNFMGGISYDVSDPVFQLRLAASSAFFGEPKYYLDSHDKSPKTRANTRKLQPVDIERLRETLNAIDPQQWRQMTPAELLEDAIDRALAHDPERTLQYAVSLRNDENIRTTPQVILVRAANHARVRGTGLIRKYANEIIRRADEPAVGLAYQLQKYGKESAIPNSLKRAWCDKLEKFDEYSLSKYRMETREVKTIDVVNLVHPKSDAINKLMRGELKTTDQTWESIVSKEGSSREAWSKALDVMGHMAVLRNCRNLLEQGLDVELFAQKLIETAPKGKQLPFRYYSAYQAVKDTAPFELLGALEKCLTNSIQNVPIFTGRTISLCDNSGSAQGATTSSLGRVKVSTIANLTGILAGMRSDDGYVGVFGDRLETKQITSNGSVFKQLDALEALAKDIGPSTENGIWLFFDKAIRNKEHWDHIFVFSDMQAGHGGLYGTDEKAYQAYAWNKRYIDVSKLVKKYRAAVNENVMIYLVQVAGYRDTLVPEFYDRTYILSGWGEGIFRFAQEMNGMYEQ